VGLLFFRLPFIPMMKMCKYSKKLPLVIVRCRYSTFALMFAVRSFPSEFGEQALILNQNQNQPLYDLQYHLMANKRLCLL